MLGYVVRPAAAASLAIVALAAALLATACSGEDRPEVEVIGGGGVVSVSGADESAGGVASGIRYIASSNQDLALQAALDLRDIRSVINVAIDGRPVEWPRAIAIYEQGKNQRRADGTLRPLASLATEGVHAMFPNGPAVYGRASFIDGIIRDGLLGAGRAQGLSEDARRAFVDRGIQMLLYGKALQSLTEAKVRVDAGSQGGATAIDEAWAIIAGPTDADGARPHSLLQAAITHEAYFKLSGKLVRPLEAAFITALAAAQKGDAATFNTYFAESKGELNAIFYLATLRAAKVVETDTTEAARQTHLVEAWASFQAIRAAVAAASPAAAQTIEAAFARPAAEAFPASETQRVYQALNEPAVWQALGIPAALQVKTPPAAS